MFGVKDRFRITALGLGLVMLTGLSSLSIIEAQVTTVADAFVAPENLAVLAKQKHAPLTIPDGRMLELATDRLTLRRSGEEGRTIALPDSRTGAAAVALPDGRILIWGGSDGYGRLLPEGLWLDATNGLLEPAVLPTLPLGIGQNLTVLSDGQVLVTGGWDATRRMHAQAIRWNPVTGARTDLVNQLQPRYMQDSAVGVDGAVYLWGGLDDRFQPIDTVERFDPVMSTFSASTLPAADSGPITIMASSPVRNAKGVGIGELIGFRFSNTVDPRSVSTATVSLIGPAGPVEGSVAGVQGRLAFVSPKGDLLPGTHYTVAIAGVRGLAGQPLPFTSLGFTTASLGTSEQAQYGQNTATTGASGAVSTSASSAQAAVGGPSSAMTLYRTTGTSAAGKAVTTATCSRDARGGYRLCRNKGYFEDGAWYPGQDNAGGPDGGHWRVNVADMAPAEIAAAMPAHRSVRQRLMATAGTVNVVTGQIRLVDGRPMAHVQVSSGKSSTYTGADGVFALSGLAVGQVTLFVDGSKADDASHHYGQFEVSVLVEPGTTTLPYRMYVPRILDRDRIELPSPTTHEMVVTHPDMPGLEVRIPAGTVMRDHNGKVVTEFAIVPMPTDRAPYPTPVNFAVYFSMQPGGAAVQNIHSDQPQGITLTYPNYGHVAAGHEASFIAYTPADGWKAYGKGQVTPDGSQLKAESGVRLATLTSGSWDMSNQHPGDSDPSKPGGARAGDPVDLLSGTLVDNVTDITIKDIIPISMSRQWHASGSSALKDASAVQDTRGFGSWRSNYDTYVNGVWDNTGIRLPDGTLLSPMVPVATNPGGDGSWVYGGNIAAYVGTTMDARLGAVQCDDASTSECYVINTPDKTQYYLSPFNGLYEIRDKFDNRVRFVRSGGQLQQVISPSGRYLSFQYNSDNNISQVSDNIGRTWAYAYHKTSFPAGGWSTAGAGSSPTMAPMYFLDSVTYPDQTVARYTYNEDFTLPAVGGGGACPAALPGTMKTIVDRNGTTILSSAYCGVQVSQQTLADGGVYKYTYLANGPETDVTDPLGRVRKVVFDATGYPSSDTRAAGTPLAQTTTFTHDASGRTLTSTDAMNRTTSFTWDAQGNPLSVTKLSGTSNAVTQSFTWTADARPLTYTDELGHTTRFNYVDGCLSSVIDPMGHTSTVQCDAQGRPVLLTDALGHSTRMDYLAGDLHAVTDALGRTATFATDGVGRMTSVTDPLGNVVLSAYDMNDRVTQSIDARGKVISYQYDNEGSVKKVTLPNTGSISYDYDARYRLKIRTDALHQAETWTYDLGGNAQTYTDRMGQSTTYAPTDALNRFTKVTFADNSTITADAYDAANRLKRVTDSAYGTVVHTYDDLDRLTGESSPQGAISYSYFSNGLRKTMNAASQPMTSYAYNENNLISSISQASETVQFGYDDANRRQSLTLPNGIIGSYGYDSANELTSIKYTTAANSAIGDIAYVYDAGGARVAQTGNFAPDLLSPVTTTAATIDLNGRKTSFNGQALTYDKNGNMTSDGSRTYVWDARNRLVQIKQGTTVVASYAYDVAGRRSSKSLNGQSTLFLYDGQNAVQETQGASISRILTGLGIDERFARTDETSRGYFMVDALGSVLAVADPMGSVTQRYKYDPYGGVSSATAGSNSYQYAGRENDQTALYYYRARYYSPTLGSFIAQDPVGLNGRQTSFYAYVGGNPLNYMDPYGLFGIDDVWAGVYRATGGWEPSQGAVDYWAGLGDGASLGVTSLVRDAMGTNDQVDECSTAYKMGGWSSFALGAGRIAYAGLAKVGARAAASGIEASAFRSALRTAFGGGKSFRPPNLAKYATDDALRAAAGRTNLFGNTWGAGATATGAYEGSGGKCGCQE